MRNALPPKLGACARPIARMRSAACRCAASAPALRSRSGMDTGKVRLCRCSSGARSPCGIREGQGKRPQRVGWGGGSRRGFRCRTDLVRRDGPDAALRRRDDGSEVGEGLVFRDRRDRERPGPGDRRAGPGQGGDVPTRRAVLRSARQPTWPWRSRRAWLIHQAFQPAPDSWAMPACCKSTARSLRHSLSARCCALRSFVSRETAAACARRASVVVGAPILLRRGRRR